jgi:hypothetical protein
MSPAPAELIIEAGRTERNYWRDLFRYRELFYFLACRDVLVRYRSFCRSIARRAPMSSAFRKDGYLTRRRRSS